MRCEKHGLATASDGLCVLCRRETRALDPPPTVTGTGTESSWIGPNLMLLAMLAVATAGFLSSRAMVGLGVTGAGAHQPVPTEDEGRSEDGVTSGIDGERYLDDDPERYQAALERVEINVYFAPWCPACKAARSWLRAKKIPYRGFDVERDPGAARRLRELNPRGSIPTIEIDGKVAVGFNQTQLTAMLDAAVARRQQEL